MQKRPILLLHCVVLILFVLIPYSYASSNSIFKWQVGEELVYKVNWSFLRLGTLKICVYDVSVRDSTLIYHVKMTVDSNPLLFFVSIHSVYECDIDQDFRLCRYAAHEKIEGVTYQTDYYFNYQDSVIIIEMTDIKNPDHLIKRQEPLNDRIMDANTMLFYARAFCHNCFRDTITSFYEGKRGQFLLQFHGEGNPIKIRVMKKPQETYYINGVSKMMGLAGLTGPFEGWFAADSQRPPLKAKMKVFIGNVVIELEKWKNWNQFPNPNKKIN